MIVTTREHVLDYLGINTNLDKALSFIAETDISALDDGSYPIDGEDVRVKVQHMRTKTSQEARLEAHEAYADIQMLLEGTECIGWRFRDAGLCETEAAPERDIWFYEGSYEQLELRPGWLAIVFPDDVHAPGLCTEEPSSIRKAVFKVRLK